MSPNREADRKMGDLPHHRLQLLQSSFGITTVFCFGDDDERHLFLAAYNGDPYQGTGVFAGLHTVLQPTEAFAILVNHLLADHPPGTYADLIERESAMVGLAGDIEPGLRFIAATLPNVSGMPANDGRADDE